MEKEVLILGGGASGLMAALAAAESGARVTVLEKNNRVGKKLLATGNGRCNLSNVNQDLCHYHCDDPEFPARALGCFGQVETVRFFEQLGISVKNKNGYLYPYSEQASAVAEALRMEAEHRRVKLACSTVVKQVGKKGERFFVETPGWTYQADALILACGSPAYAGGSGDGYAYAKGFGHKVSQVLPALVQLRADKGWSQQLAGIRLDARVCLIVDGELCKEDTGEVQLFAYGISGIPTFQVSRYASRALAQRSQVEVCLQLLPQFPREQVGDLLRERARQGSYKRVTAWLLGLFPQKFIPVLLLRANISEKKLAGELMEQELDRLTEQIVRFRVPITGTNGYEQAQVCTGGVAVSQVEPETMESRLVKGLYFAGELLDVDGDCGGYNLQWAWTSGRLAGLASAGTQEGNQI